MKFKSVDRDNLGEEPEAYVAWYTMRTLSINEDKVVSNMYEKIKYYGLEEKILDIQVVKEFVIEESKDYLPNSPDLPMKVVKRGEKTIWVKTPFATFRKIKLVEKRPFKGMIFIKLLFDFELIKTIKSWDRTTYFLGDPNPQAMTDASFAKMRASISSDVPCIHEFMKENHYTVVNGALRSAEVAPIKESKRQELLKKIEEKKAKEQALKMEKEKKPETKHTRSVLDPINIGKPIKDINKLKVNDYVFVSDFGAQGQVKSIDVATGEIIVSIQAFGRSQPITCDISKLREI